MPLVTTLKFRLLVHYKGDNMEASDARENYRRAVIESRDHEFDEVVGNVNRTIGMASSVGNSSVRIQRKDINLYPPSELIKSSPLNEYLKTPPDFLIEKLISHLEGKGFTVDHIVGEQEYLKVSWQD